MHMRDRGRPSAGRESADGLDLSDRRKSAQLWSRRARNARISPWSVGTNTRSLRSSSNPCVHARRRSETLGDTHSPPLCRLTLMLLVKREDRLPCVRADAVDALEPVESTENCADNVGNTAAGSAVADALDAAESAVCSSVCASSPSSDDAPVSVLDNTTLPPSAFGKVSDGTW